MTKKYSKRKVLQFIAMLLGSALTLMGLSFIMTIPPHQVVIWPPVIALLFVIALNAGEKTE